MQLRVHFELILKNCARGKKREFPLKVDFETDERRTVIFGPSGCGKSVTFQVIAGLIKPAKSVITFGERTLSDNQRGIFIPAHKRRIGYVFQDYALFPHLSVVENVGYALRQWPYPLSSPHKKRILDMLDSFGMACLAESFPHELSGGQQQRVALARALISEPEILLLDEPFSAMDTLLRTKMREELGDIQHRFKTPSIIITHDLDDVKEFADTLIIYQPHCIASVINCRQLYEKKGKSQGWTEISELCRKQFKI